jgi:hypothetical protein
VVTTSDSLRGSVNITSPVAADENGFYSGAVIITAVPIAPYVLSYWLVNGVKVDSPSPLSFTIEENTAIRAVFEQIVQVTDFTDSGSAATTPGTLRYALTNQQNGMLIRFMNASSQTVTLAAVLPAITTSISIEGNGITITRSWNTGNNTQLLRITDANAEVNISRVHFKDGRANGNGAAIYNAGVLSLESCIFSGNQITGMMGGAIYNYNTGNMNVKGCTFYGNSAGNETEWTGRGGAIYNAINANAKVTLEGNLFYGNTAVEQDPVVSGGGVVTSNGYNVVNVPLGTGETQSGFAAASNNTDKTLQTLLGNNNTSPFVNAASGNFAPLDNRLHIITTQPDGFPSKDFFDYPRTWPGAPGAVK